MVQALYKYGLGSSIGLGLILPTLIPAIAAAEAFEAEQFESMSQVTSVSQLSDVKPTDWAFQALQSLVERYGCIAGYPNKTFRGNQALTRYEFAAGLNACLGRVNELIAASASNFVKKEDLATLQKLQEQFSAELATIRGRVDALESRTATLEKQQFSTTTKLNGEVIFAVTDAGYEKRGIRNSNTTPGVTPSGDFNPYTGTNATVISRVRFNLSTSFTGEDLLYTQLQSGNGGQTVASLLGQTLGLGGNIRFNTFDLDYAGASSNVALNYLFYKFPLFTKDLQVTIGPVDSTNSYVDFNRYSPDEVVGFSSTAFRNNPLLFPVPGGIVASATWNPGGGAFTLRGVYTSGNAAPTTEPSTQAPQSGKLFGDPNQGNFELEFAPKNGNQAGLFALRLQYMTATVGGRNYEVGGINAELPLSPKFGLFGRYGFGRIRERNPSNFDGFTNTDFTGTRLNPSTWQAGIGFSDLFIRGSSGAIAVGQPFIESNVGNSTQTNVEAFYRIPINDNIAISPDLQFIFNPNNNADNSTITIGTIRTVFTF